MIMMKSWLLITVVGIYLHNTTRGENDGYIQSLIDKFSNVSISEKPVVRNVSPHKRVGVASRAVASPAKTIDHYQFQVSAEEETDLLGRMVKNFAAQVASEDSTRNAFEEEVLRIIDGLKIKINTDYVRDLVNLLGLLEFVQYKLYSNDIDVAQPLYGHAESLRPHTQAYLDIFSGPSDELVHYVKVERKLANLIHNVIGGKCGARNLSKYDRSRYISICQSLEGSNILDIIDPQSYLGHEKCNIESFQPIRRLGSGAFGTVYLAKYLVEGPNKGNLFAVKALNKLKMKNNLEDAIWEVKAMMPGYKSINSPFLLTEFCTFQTREYAFIVMEYLSKFNFRELKDFFNEKNLNKERKESIVKLLMAKVLLGLEDLHARGIVHLDLKPENVMFDRQGNPRIIDYGLSKKLDPSGLAQYKRDDCYHYHPPEYNLNFKQVPETCTASIDLYSFGISILEILTGADADGFCEYEDNMDYMMDLIEGYSAHLKNFLLNVLHPNPQMRLNSISGIKAHIWFRGINWDRMRLNKIATPKSLYEYFPFADDQDEYLPPLKITEAPEFRTDEDDELNYDYMEDMKYVGYGKSPVLRKKRSAPSRQ